MPKARRSKEYRQFDTLMGELLTVPKAALTERMDAHKATVAATPQHRKRGPKPKVTRPSDDAPAADGLSAGLAD